MKTSSVLIVGGGLVAVWMLSRASSRPVPSGPVVQGSSYVPPQVYGDPTTAPGGSPATAISQDVLNYTQAATGLLGAIGTAYGQFGGGDD